MPTAKERALAELRALQAVPADPVRRALEDALEAPETRKLHAAIARGAATARHAGAFDTGRRQPIDPPPCWVPPVV